MILDNRRHLEWAESHLDGAVTWPSASPARLTTDRTARGRAAAATSAAAAPGSSEQPDR